MRRAEVLQEIRKMRFKETYEEWNTGRLTQSEAAQILGMCERSFRRHLSRFEADGLEGLIDRRLTQASNRESRCTWTRAASEVEKVRRFSAQGWEAALKQLAL